MPVIFLCLFLVGCVSVPFVPFTVEIKDQAYYEASLSYCQEIGRYYVRSRTGLDVADIASSGSQEVLENLPSAAISPVVVPVSGLSGASKEVLVELGVNGTAEKQVVAECLHDRGEKSGLFNVYDPLR